MKDLVTDVREMVMPDPAGPHGVLPPLLLTLTVVTGLVDAFSYPSSLVMSLLRT